MVKIYWQGVVFHPTGVASHHREIIRGLIKKGIPVHVFDFYNPDFDDSKQTLGNNAYSLIDYKDKDVCTILTYRPDMWLSTQIAGDVYGLVVHEGSKIPENWGEIINRICKKIIVPSKATKNLFFNGGVRVPIHIVPEGIDTNRFNPKIKPREREDEIKDKCVFLSVNSWTGAENDRKGTDILIKAFLNEFTEEDDVALYLKISTFFMPQYDAEKLIKNIGKEMGLTKIPTIIADQTYLEPSKLPQLYRMADCFVSPTMGESWGLTIHEAMASGLPVILTKNNEAGYMDFVGDFPFWIETKEKIQADRRFFVEGNLMPKPDIDSLRKRMREVYELWKKDRNKLKDRGIKGSNHVSKYTGEYSAQKLVEVLKK
ncbi:MAG: glycosyltransferase [Candidatus Schekmanbacteria bacterium]|nr:MAG: glycosyltransferase [Candidatus Schekmanbacteria bacterium]